jgi:hypothetical protein
LGSVFWVETWHPAHRDVDVSGCEYVMQEVTSVLLSVDWHSNLTPPRSQSPSSCALSVCPRVLEWKELISKHIPRLREPLKAGKPKGGTGEDS